MTIDAPLKWHGGKHYLAPWLHKNAPPQHSNKHTTGYRHRIIACAGGLGEFWNWPHEGISEVVNDINGQLTNFYKVLQSRDEFTNFKRIIEVMPLSELEWELTHNPNLPIPHIIPNVEAAVGFFVRMRQSRQGLGKSFTTLSKSRTRRGMQESVSSWLTAVEGLHEVHQRLIRVAITRKPAPELIQQEDSVWTFVYLDPPYKHDARVTTEDYDYEMTDAQHYELLDTLAGMNGRFMLSGYRNEMYDAFADSFKWRREDKEIVNNASSKKTKDVKIESIWMNYDKEGNRT